MFKRKSDEKGVPPMFKSEVIINDCNAEFLVTCYESMKYIIIYITVV